MKKSSLLLFLAVFLFFGQLYGVTLYQFSKNKKIKIIQIKMLGTKLMKKAHILDIMDMKEDSSFFIYEIQKGLASLIASGFFDDVKYKLTSKKEGFVLELKLVENPPLASLKVLDEKMLNLGVFREKLSEQNIAKGRVFSRSAVQKAIDEFNMYNQSYGVFLYQVNFRVISKEEIKKARGLFLFSPEELRRPGVHVVVNISSVPRLYIHEIRMQGTSIAYDEILNFLKLDEKMWVDDDNELFFRFKRLRRLGFYESVYFKLTPLPLEGPAYRLSITLKELTLEDLTTTLTAPANIGIVTSVEYYNIALFETLQRFRAGVGWELALGTPTFVLEYTHPYFWKGLFVDVTISKEDEIAIYSNTSDQILTNNYNVKGTVGYNVFGSFFTYLFQKETYAITSRIDEDFDKVPGTDERTQLLHSTGLMILFDNLDDNFFIQQGFKAVLEYEAYWKEIVAHKMGFSGEIYLPIPAFSLIGAFAHRSYVLLTDDADTKTTLSLDQRMRTNVQEVGNIDEQQIKLTTYTSIELRFPLPEIKGIVRDLSFLVFAEAGGAWSDLNGVRMEETRYGFGIGFRLSPRRHYSSFLFQFPAGLYLGYRTGDKSPRFAGPISHRDNLYYINLTASF